MKKSLTLAGDHAFHISRPRPCLFSRLVKVLKRVVSDKRSPGFLWLVTGRIK